MTPPDAPYYRSDLARVHHLGFGFHADACAPGILALVEGQGLDVTVQSSFGSETLPAGLRVVVGRRVS